jgi:cell division protein FtsL
MLSKDRKNIKRNFGEETLFPVFLAVFLVFIGIFLIITNWKIHDKRADLNKKIGTLQAEIKDLEQKNAELKDSASQAESPDYIESVAREKLGMKAPGEEVVVVPDNNQAENAPTPTPVPVKQSWWQWLLGKLKI